MSEDTLITAYRIAYWNKNELQIVLCDFPSYVVQSEVDKLERLQSRIVESLGYMPSV